MAHIDVKTNRTGSNWKRPFFTIWIGQAVSLLGSQLVQFALIWWLTKLTESAVVLTTATLVGILPRVVLGPFVGALVDRWDRRKIMALADSGIALATLLLAYLFFINRAAIWVVYVILFFRALGSGFHSPAMTSSTSLMVPHEHLTRIQGLNQTLQNGLNIVSAPLGAILLDVLSVQGILAIDVISALFGITPLFFIAIPRPDIKTLSQKERLVESVWEDFKIGLRYINRWAGLKFIMVMAVSINMIVTPAFALLPLLVRKYFEGGALQLGWLESSFSIGAFAGGLLLSLWGGFQKKILTSQMGLIILSLGMAAIAFIPASRFPYAIAAFFLIGTALPLANGPINAILQSTVDPGMQGRVFTLTGSFASAVSPLGLIVAGPLAEVFNIQLWYIGGGIMTLLFGIGGLFSKALMTFEDNPHQPREKISHPVVT